MSGLVGEQNLSNGAIALPRLDEGGRLVASNKYADPALADRLFSVANQTSVKTTAALATTWTGLGVGNPSTSGKNYVFQEFGWQQEILTTTEGTVGLMVATVGDMTQAIVPRAALYESRRSAALCDDGATIGTPILIRMCGCAMEGAINKMPSRAPNIYKIDGSIIIPPGYALLSYTFSIQTPAALLFHFLWEEASV